MFKVVVGVLALIGFTAIGSATVCWTGLYPAACIIDLTPSGGDMICRRQGK